MLNQILGEGFIFIPETSWDNMGDIANML